MQSLPTNLSTQFLKHIKQKHAKLKHLLKECTAYRLYNREIPGIPLTIDRYGNFLYVSNLSTNSGQSLAQCKTVTEQTAEIAARAIGIASSQIVIRIRGSTTKQDGIRTNAPRKKSSDSTCSDSLTFNVYEGGLKFEVNLSDYLDTGLFLDHRLSRAIIRDFIIDSGTPMRLLNLFSYTGSFSVYAADGGAETLSIDMSRTYCDWAERNFQQNAFPIGKQHRIIQADALQWLATGHSEEKPFDIIICDPPTFSNSNRMNRVFRIQQDHPEIIQNCINLLKPNGIIFFSTNYAGFSLRTKEISSKFSCKNITKATFPPDFAQGHPHSSWIISRESNSRKKMT